MFVITHSSLCLLLGVPAGSSSGSGDPFGLRAANRSSSGPMSEVKRRTRLLEQQALVHRSPPSPMVSAYASNLGCIFSDASSVHGDSAHVAGLGPPQVGSRAERCTARSAAAQYGRLCRANRKCPTGKRHLGHLNVSNFTAEAVLSMNYEGCAFAALYLLQRGTIYVLNYTTQRTPEL